MERTNRQAVARGGEINGMDEESWKDLTGARGERLIVGGPKTDDGGVVCREDPGVDQDLEPGVRIQPAQARAIERVTLFDHLLIRAEPGFRDRPKPGIRWLHPAHLDFPQELDERIRLRDGGDRLTEITLAGFVHRWPRTMPSVNSSNRHRGRVGPRRCRSLRAKNPRSRPRQSPR